jgi:hypothetical protein
LVFGRRINQILKTPCFSEPPKEDLIAADVIVHLGSMEQSALKPCCARACLAQLCTTEREAVAATLASYLASASRREREIFLMGCIRFATAGPHNTLSIPVPSVSIHICRIAFCALFDVSQDRFAALRHLVHSGVLYPAVHGLTGKPSNSSVSAEQLDGVVEFVLRLASARGRSQAAVPMGRTPAQALPSTPLVVLPAQYTVQYVQTNKQRNRERELTVCGSAIYETLYRRWALQRAGAADSDAAAVPVSYGVFFAVWNRDARCRHVMTKRHAALRCDTCLAYENKAKTCSVSELAELTGQWRAHIGDAIAVWEAYQNQTSAMPDVDSTAAAAAVTVLPPPASEWHLFFTGVMRRRGEQDEL